nr:rhomboid family intramembrane serine protease [uncultured Psychroserpens sp.]
MTSLTHDIKDKLKHLNVFEKIIALNVLVFFVGWLLRVLRRIPRERTLDWLELPNGFSDFIVKPWSIFSYGFAHYDPLHIIFNMLVLYFVSRTMVNLFPTKQSLNIYFMGIIVGGILYLLAYNIMPAFFVDKITVLVGASAGVNALLIFICAYMPYREAKFFTVKIKLWYLGVAIVAFDLIRLFSGVNQGGMIAHLGGSLLGYAYATQLLKGKDIGKGFGKFMDRVANLFKSKSTLKTVHKSKKKAFAGHNKDEFNEFNNQKKVDLILDKISKSGYDSLTKEEKTFLFKSGKD